MEYLIEQEVKLLFEQDYMTHQEALNEQQYLEYIDVLKSDLKQYNQELRVLEGDKKGILRKSVQERVNYLNNRVLEIQRELLY